MFPDSCVPGRQRAEVDLLVEVFGSNLPEKLVQRIRQRTFGWRCNLLQGPTLPGSRGLCRFCARDIHWCRYAAEP